MKKLVFLIIVILSNIAAAMAQSPTARRAWSLGLVGGITETRLENYGGGFYSTFDDEFRWQIGIAGRYTWRQDRFFNYSLQGEVRYVRSATDVIPVLGPDLGVVELDLVDVPVRFQMGLQLSPIFRPFIQIGPNFTFVAGSHAEFLDSYVLPLHTFAPGFDTGFGFDLWHFQFQCNYRWGLTSVNRNRDLYNNLNLRGFEFSLGILF